MSENSTPESTSSTKTGFSPFNNEGEDPKVDAYKWGFNFKSIKGANTDMTWGWKASGVYGLSTSVYINLGPLGPVQAAGVIPMALATMITNSETTYSAAKAWSNLFYMLSPSDITDLSKRRFRDFQMRIPAYMTIEVGAKCDFIGGNKYDFCTGSVNKNVNGETVICHSDKVEWYTTNLYKYIGGSETKMEAKKLNSSAIGNTSNVTRTDVLNDKNSYAKKYKQHADYNDAKSKEDTAMAAGKDMSVTCGGTYTLGAKKATVTSQEDMSYVAGGAASISSTKNISLGSATASASLYAGVNPGVQVSAAETKIANKLTLGMPGGRAPADVASALAAYGTALAELKSDLSLTSVNLNILAAEMGKEMSLLD